MAVRRVVVPPDDDTAVVVAELHLGGRAVGTAGRVTNRRALIAEFPIARLSSTPYLG
jgi:hypothetical protein